MEIEIQKKVQRFVELSKKFTVGAEEIFETDVKNAVSLRTYSSGILSSDGSAYTFTISDEKEPTRLEKFKEENDRKVKLAEEYEEYLTLQENLSDYFKSVKNLLEDE